MTRRPKTNRVPKTRANNEWTEASFWNFLRSGLRRMSMRWPPLARHALEDVKRPNESENKRLKWEYQCRECDGWFPRKQVNVDHIEECGQLKSWDDFQQFGARLFCEADGLQVLCKECHEMKREKVK